MKFSIRGKKTLEVSKKAPKRANKKEIKGHTTLTLELSTMKTQKQEKKKMNAKTPKIKSKHKKIIIIIIRSFITTKKEKKYEKGREVYLKRRRM